MLVVILSAPMEHHQNGHAAWVCPQITNGCPPAIYSALNSAHFSIDGKLNPSILGGTTCDIARSGTAEPCLSFRLSDVLLATILAAAAGGSYGGAMRLVMEAMHNYASFTP